MNAEQLVANFGNPADQSNFVTIISPFPMRLAWDKNKTVIKITVHQKAAKSLSAILQELLDTYGLETIKELGIDLFGGCFNHRPMRGTEERYQALMDAGQTVEAYKYLSLHSWALAIDLDPERNKLKETKITARFARKEYKPMLDVFYKHGWFSLGVEKNYDWMHLQFVKP